MDKEHGPKKTKEYDGRKARKAREVEDYGRSWLKKWRQTRL